MNANMILNLPTPSVTEVQKCIDKWNLEEKFVREEKRLDELFTETYPLNTDAEKIFTKIKELNKKYKTFYKTNEALRKVAEHIVNLHIDDKLLNGDFDIVDKISYIKFDANKKVVHHFSFASKYCGFHFPEKYALFDRNATTTLYYFNKSKEPSMLTESMIDDYGKILKTDYKTYIEILDAFKEKYKLQQFSPRDFDHYLWFTGKTIIDAIKPVKKKN